MAMADFWTALAESYDGNKINPFAFLRAFSGDYRNKLAAQRGLATQGALAETESAKNQQEFERRLGAGGRTSPGGFPINWSGAVPLAGQFENMQLRPAQQAGMEANTAAIKGQESRAQNQFNWLTGPFSSGPQNTPRGMQFEQGMRQNEVGMGATQAQTEAQRANNAWAQYQRDMLKNTPANIQESELQNQFQRQMIQPQLDQKSRESQAIYAMLSQIASYNPELAKQVTSFLGNKVGMNLATVGQEDPFIANLKASLSGQKLPSAQSTPPAGKPNFGYQGDLPFLASDVPPIGVGNMPPIEVPPETPINQETIGKFGFPVPTDSRSFMQKYVVPDFGKIGSDLKKFIPSLTYETPPTVPSANPWSSEVRAPSVASPPAQEQQLPWMTTDQPPRPPMNFIVSPNATPNPSAPRQPVQRNLNLMKENAQPQSGPQFPPLLQPQQIPGEFGPAGGGAQVAPGLTMEDIKMLIAALLQQQGVA